MTQQNKQIAMTILQQLGGNRFIAMTGAKKFIALDNGIKFNIGKNATRANYVTITLNALDLYDMKFEYISMNKKTLDITKKLVAECNSLYHDMLQNAFTKQTGLYTQM